MCVCIDALYVWCVASASWEAEVDDEKKKRERPKMGWSGPFKNDQ